MKDECAIHGEEPIPDKYYKICTECWHCFVTAEALEIADLNIRQGIMPNRLHEVLPASRIHICPMCTHDF